VDKKKTIMGLIVVSSLLITLLPYSALITAQSIEHQNSTTQRFMEAALRARERTYQLRELLMEKIGSIPDGVEDLLNDANTLLEDGDIQKAIEAMEKYRMAYKHMHQYLVQNGINPDAPEKAKGILVAITQSQVRIEKLNNTINTINNTLDENDPNYEEVKNHLEWGWENLTQATHNLNLANESLYLEQPNVIWAAHNLTEANMNIREAHVALTPIARLMNHRRIRAFLYDLDQLRERIRSRIWERFRPGGYPMSAFLESQGYNNMEEFEQVIDELMEYVRQHAEQSREAAEYIQRITQRLNDMELGMQNQWQSRH
jgi:tetratricopeptide (TPR) repeat protein